MTAHTLLPSELERYLHDHIPLSAAMQVRVQSTGPEEVLLGAPLAPNINHRDTVFGGSASAVAILAAWSLVHVRLLGERHTCRIVIQRSTVEYTAPIFGDFIARASVPDRESWSRFATVLGRRGRARIHVSATLESSGEIAGRFEGDFVALRMAPKATI